MFLEPPTLPPVNKDASGLVDAGGAGDDLDDALLRGASGGETMRSVSSSASAVPLISLPLLPLWRVRCSSGSSDENMGSKASNDDDEDDDDCLDNGTDGVCATDACDEAKSPNSADGGGADGAV